MRQFGTIVSALAMLGVAALVVWVGLRPATRALIDLREPLLPRARWRWRGRRDGALRSTRRRSALIGEAAREDQAAAGRLDSEAQPRAAEAARAIDRIR